LQSVDYCQDSVTVVRKPKHLRSVSGNLPSFQSQRAVPKIGQPFFIAYCFHFFIHSKKKILFLPKTIKILNNVYRANKATRTTEKKEKQKYAIGF